MAEETPLEILETFTTMTSGASALQYLSDNPTAFEDMLSAAMSVVTSGLDDEDYNNKVGEVFDTTTSMISAVSDLVSKAEIATAELEASQGFEGGYAMSETRATSADRMPPPPEE